MGTLVCDIISSMDGNTVSANTKNLQKFQVAQKARSMLFIAAIVVPLFLATAAYVTYTSITSPNNNEEDLNAVFEGAEPITGGAAGSSDAPNTEITPPAPPSTEASGSGATQSPQQNGGSSSSAAAGSSSSVPTALNTALKSIEANGIKGSAYVSSNLDTSQIPDGTSISFNRSSWSPVGSRTGSIKATVTAYGQPRTGSVTFEESGGVWRATGYSLDQ